MAQDETTHVYNPTKLNTEQSNLSVNGSPISTAAVSSNEKTEDALVTDETVWVTGWRLHTLSLRSALKYHVAVLILTISLSALPCVCSSSTLRSQLSERPSYQ